MRPAAPTRVALAQWPVVAVAWLAQAAVLFHLLLTRVPADLVSIGQRTAIGMAILFLVALEISLLTLLGLLADLGLGRVAGGRLADLVKAAAVALLFASSLASALKYGATGVHLKLSDLWFAAANFRQIVQEGLRSEIVSLLALPLAALAAGAALYPALRRARRRPAPFGWPPLVLLTLLVAIGFASTWLTSPATRLFTAALSPEGHLATRVVPALARGGGRGTRLPAEAAALGPEIVPYRPPRGERRPNVVLVMLESVPWQRTALGGGRAGVTPHLDRLAAESVVFSRAYATSTHSDYAQMSILSSLHPRKYDGHDFYVQIDYPRTLLWDALGAAGWSSAMFSCQNERWGNMLSFLDTPGLGLLRHALDWPRARRRGWGLESKVFEETPVEEWARWRRSGKEPYLTYLNFQATHFPYEVPPGAPRPDAPWEIDFGASFFRYPRERVPVLLNRYHNALRYADDNLGRVVEVLRQRGEWERTALVVVADHGEAFYEHAEPTHGSALYEEQVRSLLLMRLPGEAPRRIDQPVSLLDVAPTLLSWLGLPPHGNFQGRGDLLDPGYRGDRRPLFFTIQGITAEDGVLLGDRKYVVNWDRRTRRLFDLARDPGETVNRIAEDPEGAALLDRALIDFLRGQVAYYGHRMWTTGRYPARLP